MPKVSVVMPVHNTKEEYESRIPAIIDNYSRAMSFLNPFDYMYENYLK